MVVQDLACIYGWKSAIWQLSWNCCTCGHSAACSYCVCRWSSTDSWRPLQRQSCSSQSTETAPTAARTASVESSGWLPSAARLASLVALLWPDASQDNDSDIARLLRLGQSPHSGVWTTSVPTQELPISLARLLDQRTLNQCQQQPYRRSSRCPADCHSTGGIRSAGMHRL